MQQRSPEARRGEARRRRWPLGGAEERRRGEEEGLRLVLQIGIQDTLELDLWMQLLGYNKRLKSGSEVNGQQCTAFGGSKVTILS